MAPNKKLDLMRNALLAVVVADPQHSFILWEHTRSAALLALHMQQQALAYSVIAASGKRRRQSRRLLHLRDRIDVDLFLEDERDDLWRSYVRMQRDAFFKLVDRISEDPLFRHIRGRKQASVARQLFICVWRIAHGASVSTTQFTFRISAATVCYYTIRVTDALVRLSPSILAFPRTPAEYHNASERFAARYPQFPGCVGIIDGTHIPIIAPKNWPTEYWCFKKFYSISSLCVVDADLRFIFFRSGYPGVRQDTHNFEDSELWHARTVMQQRGVYLLGDKGFTCSPTMIVPYRANEQGGGSPEKRDLFNSVMAQVRSAVERTFGILKSQWRITKNTLVTATVDVAIRIISASFVLHNWCRMTDTEYGEHYSDDEEAHDENAVEGGNHGPPVANADSTTAGYQAGELIRLQLIEHMITIAAD